MYFLYYLQKLTIVGEQCVIINFQKNSLVVFTKVMDYGLHLKFTTTKKCRALKCSRNNAFVIDSEAFARRSSIKKVFLKVSKKNSQGNICVGVYFF